MGVAESAAGGQGEQLDSGRASALLPPEMERIFAAASGQRRQGLRRPGMCMAPEGTKAVVLVLL